MFCGSGCWSDIVELARQLKQETSSYEWNSKRPMSVHALARYLSNKLYSRRMFPYFAFTIIGGLDSAGKFD